MVIWTGMAPHSFDGYLALDRDFGRISGFLAKFVNFRDLFSEILDFRLANPLPSSTGVVRTDDNHGGAAVAGYPSRRYQCCCSLIFMTPG
jgi:hypothetical protein